jgi:hypothetical protein
MSDKADLAFNFKGITSYEMGAFLQAIRTSDIPAICEGMARIVTTCPYGEPGDPATYGNLPYFGEFQDVVTALNDAIATEAGKLKKR